MSEELKPKHKFNNGRGATLCHRCGVIITEGLTDDLYCSDEVKCAENKKRFQDALRRGFPESDRRAAEILKNIKGLPK